MAVCLEVVEHLKPESATIICESLTSMSDLVVFSAAIPGQRGQNHLNEQYPQYWVKIFESMGYFLVDDIKLDIWENSEIEWWYRQNLMILKKNPNAEEKKKLFFAIHPELYQIKVEECQRSARDYQKVIRGKISITRGIKILAKALLNSLKF